ncbi:MAG TPA: TlpA disulfide reductase family protein, partial [Bryobacterales bacterium]|nr:TlpA disulfide reductase family protein [Bryobacterales bacterium]
VTIAFIVSLRPSFEDLTGPAVEVGDQAPEFSLMSESGQPIQLKDFHGKFLILNFWATWCPPCVEELPSLERFHSQFASRGVVVLGVSEDEDRAAYEQFLQKAGVQFQTVRDPNRKVSHLYGTFKYPETYFIDGNGKVVQKVIGPTNWTDPRMTGFMEQLLRS